jgi:hypothetical protein
MPQASKAKCSPEVAEFTANACMSLGTSVNGVSVKYRTKASSNFLLFAPVVIQPERKVSTTSSISASPISGAAKGKKGKFIKDFR